jgi:hypothetical protein
MVVTMGVAVAMVLLLATSALASHASVEISISLDTVVRDAEGSVTELGRADVPEGFAGHQCEVRVHTQNQNSVHPGNDIVVKSGASQVLLPDVEGEPGKVIDSDSLLELGDVITVSLIMGPDGVFSAGSQVVVECVAEETTTTAEVKPTSESTSTTEAVTSTEDTTPPAVEPTQATTPPTDEVKGTEVLPFTGAEESQLGLLALALLAGGTLIVVGTRRREE